MGRSLNEEMLPSLMQGWMCGAMEGKHVAPDIYIQGKWYIAFIISRRPSWLGRNTQQTHSSPPQMSRICPGKSGRGSSPHLGNSHCRSSSHLNHPLATDVKVAQARPPCSPQHFHWGDVIVIYLATKYSGTATAAWAYPLGTGPRCTGCGWGGRVWWVWGSGYGRFSGEELVYCYTLHIIPWLHRNSTFTSHSLVFLIFKLTCSSHCPEAD